MPDKGQNLKIKIDGLRIKYPLMITDIEIGCVAGTEGKLRDDGWRCLPATLHRISGDFNQ